MRITDPRLNNVGGRETWRTHFRQALFRDEIFFVETGNEAGGRRVAMHEYPKRNVPYAEDMGRAARVFSVQGYLIGPFYFELKDKLIAALEKDGPGRLRLPMMYMRSDMTVMVQSYTITEARERGAFCGVAMQFCEYGNPKGRENISTPSQIMTGSENVEQLAINQQPVTTELQKEMAKFAELHLRADLPNMAPPLN